MTQDETAQGDETKSDAPVNDGSANDGSANDGRVDDARASNAPDDQSAERAPPEPTAEERLAQVNDQLLRSLAELENTRKRAERDRSEALKFGAMNFARDMLGVVDNLQRALKAMRDLGDEMPEATRSLLHGVEATERDLLAALARHKVTALDPMGEKFDANLHEAMFEAPGTGQESGTIIEIVEAGYLMEERLLRPAKVGIAKD